MDFVYNKLEIKNRQHFNEFMVSFHDLTRKKNNNTINAFVKNLEKIRFNLFR